MSAAGISIRETAGEAAPASSRPPMRPTPVIALLSVGLTTGLTVFSTTTRTTSAVVNESSRFFALRDITPDNVTTLEHAWTYHSGDFSGGRGPEPGRSVPGVQVRPVFADGLLYVTTPSSIVIALDGDTGREVWRHDPQAGAATRCYEPHRGVALWQSSAGRTVFSGTCDGRLISLDAR